eukprot:CAMPEP_0198291030 /NCGR_PEP_ID=MMETSP1449-20131203/8693_1 /TAXON_ID=420275 /ORGANISM="Attheya septentrionalis, Strain CCMP2084" /LENGTH=661 /DNA_ID=CAMNT_0043989615 /DNA_START=313 /DNA_END=2298 /DNA_ORIENTATION=-
MVYVDERSACFQDISVKEPGKVRCEPFLRECQCLLDARMTIPVPQSSTAPRRRKRRQRSTTGHDVSSAYYSSYRFVGRFWIMATVLAMFVTGAASATTVTRAKKKQLNDEEQARPSSNHASPAPPTPSSSMKQQSNRESERTVGAQKEESNPVYNELVVPPLPNVKEPTVSTTPIKRKEEEVPMTEFMTWCRQVLGIQTSLVVHYFEYPNLFQTWHEEQLRNRTSSRASDLAATTEPETKDDASLIRVRGLAASKDIIPGDVVISIPFHAMITVHTTIDHDPVLSRILGPEARKRLGWVGDSSSDDQQQDARFYEMPLLIVALLYHVSLGRNSPLWNFISHVLMKAPVDTMPILWDNDKLERDTTESVRRIARDIKADILGLYRMVEVLIEEYPHMFAAPQNSDVEWMYSYEKFEWAFAMVNSRHWNLPIQDMDSNDDQVPLQGAEKNFQEVANPPASQPTEEWVAQQQLLESDDHVESEQQRNQIMRRRTHSFLAPVADLLNFGPPCTRGTYNAQAHAFEIVSTCHIVAGQEVTFWYSSDCDDVFIANYGFTHRMVLPCEKEDEKRLEDEAQRDLAHDNQVDQNGDWRRVIGSLEEELDSLYKEMDRMRAAMQECGCEAEREKWSGHDSGHGADDEHDHMSATPDAPSKLRGERRARSEI